jgi:hypothetical protein
MKTFVIYEKQSKIVRFVENRGDNSFPVVNDEFDFVETQIQNFQPIQYFFDGNELKTRDLPPNQFYIWNNGWVLDENLWKNNQSELAKQQRDELLASTDWIVIKAKENDGEVPQIWKNYRQSLRDIPQQSGYPLDIVWPTIPV